jgi:outer membrane protein assembly factor BamE (lipoprotein component of BamABCDE complex)
MFDRLEKTGALLLISLLTAIGLACASAGTKLDRTHLDDIKEGAQSKQQIRQWFGEPYTVQPGLQGHPKGCVERWTYEYAKARGFGTVTYQEILVVDFDARGTVCDHAFSKSGQE